MVEPMVDDPVPQPAGGLEGHLFGMQRQKALVLQVGKVQGGFVCQRGIRRHHRIQPRFGHRVKFAVVQLVDHITGTEHDVQLFGFKHLFQTEIVLHVHDGVESRVLPSQSPQRRLEVLQLGAAGAADVEQPHGGVGGIVHLFLGDLDFGQDLPGIVVKAAACFGQAHHFGVADQQRCAQFRFQRLDMMGHRGRRKKQFLRRFGKVQPVCHTDKTQQLLGIHSVFPPGDDVGSSILYLFIFCNSSFDIR